MTNKELEGVKELMDKTGERTAGIILAEVTHDGKVALAFSGDTRNLSHVYLHITRMMNQIVEISYPKGDEKIESTPII